MKNANNASREDRGNSFYYYYYYFHLMPFQQSAYHQHHSTETAMLKIISDIYNTALPSTLSIIT